MFFLNVIYFYAAPAKKTARARRRRRRLARRLGLYLDPRRRRGRAYAWPDAVRRLARLKAGIAPRTRRVIARATKRSRAFEPRL